MKLSRIIYAVVLCAAASSLGALEVFQTTEQLIANTPNIVRGEIIHTTPINSGAIIEYRIRNLETLKGAVPEEFRIRMPSHLPVIENTRRQSTVGSEWIIFLGKKNSFGIFPLFSLTQGQIRIISNPRTGEEILGRRISSSTPGQKPTSATLQEFRNLVKSVSSQKRRSSKPN